MARKVQGKLQLPETKSENPQPDRFEYIRAIVEDDELRWEYKLKDGTNNRMSHDDSVRGWSDDEIRKLTRSMLGAGDGDEVEVQHG